MSVKEDFVDNADERGSRAYGVVDGNEESAGYGQRATRLVSRRRRRNRGREKKEILVFEHKLFMVNPTPDKGLSTKGL